MSGDGEDSEYKYNMSHGRRGLALVICNGRFISEEVPDRAGAESDRRLLEDMLTQLGFEVRPFSNLTTTQMLLEATRIARQRRINADSDCILVAISSHGDQDEDTKVLRYDDGKTLVYETDQVVLGTDGPLPVSDITRIFFEEDKYPELKGKPKIFIFQCCRGQDLMNSVTVKEKVHKLTRQESGSHDHADAITTDTPLTARDSHHLAEELDTVDHMSPSLTLQGELEDGSTVTATDRVNEEDNSDEAKTCGSPDLNQQISGDCDTAEWFWIKNKKKKKKTPEVNPYIGWGETHGMVPVERPGIKPEIEEGIRPLEEEETSKTAAAGGGDGVGSVDHVDDVSEPMVIVVKRVPLQKDCIAAWSVPAGYYAFSRRSGSVYIRVLCEVLKARHNEVDLETMLTEVRDRTVREFTVRSGDPALNLKQIVPNVDSVLLKELWLKSKKTET